MKGQNVSKRWKDTKYEKWALNNSGSLKIITNSGTVTSSFIFLRGAIYRKHRITYCA